MSSLERYKLSARLLDRMERESKTIYCDCGNVVSGATEMDVIRKEIDHMMKVHPDRYLDMINDLTPEQIKGWMLMQILWSRNRELVYKNRNKAK